MGREYRISCPPESLPELESFLLSAGGVPCAQFPEQIEFRFQPSAPDTMPDAMAMIEPEGLYLCDNGGAREPVAVLFRRVIDKALMFSGPSDSIVVKSL